MLPVALLPVALCGCPSSSGDDGAAPAASNIPRAAPGAVGADYPVSSALAVPPHPAHKVPPHQVPPHQVPPPLDPELEDPFQPDTKSPYEANGGGSDDGTHL